MKIALVVPSLANKGPILVAREIACALATRHVVEILYFDEVVEVDFPVPTRKIGFLDRCDLNSYDIVHSHCLRPDIFCVVRKIFNKRSRFVTTLHNLVEEDMLFTYGKLTSVMMSWFFGKIWTYFDQVVVLSDAARSYYARRFKPEIIHRIYNGLQVKTDSLDEIDLIDSGAIKELKARYCVIGVNAVLTARKGVDVLIDALRWLPHHALVIVGDGPERRRLENLAAERDVTTRTLFLGYRAHACRYTKRYDIYALPSRSEGLPIALIEALGLGVPVICSELPVFAELLHHGEAGFFSNSDMSSVLTAVRAVSDAPARFSAASLRVYRQRLTREKMGNAYENVYRNLIKSGHGLQ